MLTMKLVSKIRNFKVGPLAHTFRSVPPLLHSDIVFHGIDSQQSCLKWK